jgi:CheY-like chemotaxis protein
MIAASTVEILLVGDDPVEGEFVEEALRERAVSFRLTTVEDGGEALDYLHGEGPFASALLPDLILLDLNGVRSDGLKVLDELECDEALRHIPVIVLNADDADYLLRAYDLPLTAVESLPCRLLRC